MLSLVASKRSCRRAATFVLAVLFLMAIPGVPPSAANRPPEGLVSVEVRLPPGPRPWPFENPRNLMVPPGFEVTLFASGLGRPRMMAFGPEGNLYVSVPMEDRVIVLPDRDHDGAADEKVVFAEGLARPHGLAFRDGELLVVESGRLLALKDRDGDLRADAKRVVSADIPIGGGHWTRSVATAPGDGIFVSAGSTCNVCVEEDFRRAAVLRFSPDGGSAKLFASGLRNTVGLAVHPETGELWGVDNGRDWLGDELPPEELNRIVSKGDYGWPYCYGHRVPDPDLGSRRRCRSTTPPEAEFQAHSAPLGIAFGYGLAFPSPYRDVLYIAYHGSWNRTKPTGYKLVGVPFKDGGPSGPPFDFATGWLVHEKGEFWGRPVAPVVGPDGALYLSDDFAGAVYRIAPTEEDKSLTVGPAGGGI